MGIINFFRNLRKPKKIKIGLALGSGGAKGFAELGAIRAFEDNGISFDCFAGTSIGSIIGAFLADGYSSTDIYELISSVNFSEITNLLMIKMDTSGMFRVIDRTIGSLDIEELKKPFACVATEINSGEERVFKKGNVAIALCASSSFPPFFKPVVIDNERFVDGAFSNSVPADLVREMGADYVIGIDLSDHQPAKNGILNRLFPTYKGKTEQPWKKGYDYSDIMLKPDLTGYKAVSFRSGAEMFDIGYKTALDEIPTIKQNLAKLQKKKR